MKVVQIKELLTETKHQNFIIENLKADFTKMLLKFSKDGEKRLLIEQIAQKQRARKKLPTYFENPLLLLPPSLNLGQASSEETAAIKAEWIKPGLKMVDLTGGLGIDFSHFASKFKQAQYVEPNEELLQTAKHNFEILGLKGIEYHNTRAEAFLSDLEVQDFIYMDPSRKDSKDQNLIKIEDYQPNLLDLLPSLSKKTRQLLVKLSPMINIPHYLQILEGVSEVWVISQRNDCKEVCFLWDFEKNRAFKFRTINLNGFNDELFETGDSQFTSSLAKELGDYLYLPNSSILKAGIQDKLTDQFPLTKLDSNTHIFTSQKLLKCFPGRVFKQLRTTKAYDSSFKKGAYNVVSKNFPEKAELIANKLKIKKSHNSLYLIACRFKSRPLFIEAEQILN